MSLLADYFCKLDAVLSQYQTYWNFVPFECDDYPWDSSPLTEYLVNLSQFPEQAHPLICQQIANVFFPELGRVLQEINLVEHELIDHWQKPMSFNFLKGIHGRKIAQVQQLSSQINPVYPILEWCAGKGHLGRILSYQHNMAVTSVEWQQSLCKQGVELAKFHDVKQNFIHADVLKQAAVWLQPDQHVVALHACGDLHVVLLKQAIAVKTKCMHIAPCCYHLIGDDVYPALSSYGQKSQLKIAKPILKLAIQAPVVAGEKIQNQRKTEVLWRLAYQLIRAEVTGDSKYRSLPSVKKFWFSGDFIDFVKWGASHQNITLPTQLDLDYYLKKAAIKQKYTQQLEYVRHVFQAALELWLVLDKALFLEQNGYCVDVNYFCPHSTTPRNLMIVANIA